MTTNHWDAEWTVWLIGVALLIAYGVYKWLLDRRRVRELEKFLYKGDFIPSVNVDQKLFSSSEPRISKLERAYTGTFTGRRAIIADFRIGAGKGSYSQTFVAVERPTDAVLELVPIISALSIEYQQTGRWLIGTVTKQTLGTDAIEGYLRCFT